MNRDSLRRGPCRIRVKRLVLLLMNVATLFSCGKDAADPGQVQRLTFVAGHNLSDTISTLPIQGLVLRLLDEQGKPEVGVDVRFEAPTASRMFVGGVGQTGFGPVATARTDSDGRAAVRIVLSTSAGPGWVAALVPLHGLTDTARYTILPGQPVRVMLSPRDTTLLLGGSFAYRGSTFDRANNARTDPATYEAIGGGLRVSAAGQATAEGPGIARVRVRATIGAATVSDSGTVAVVPDVVVMWNSGPFTNNTMTGRLNGSEIRVLIANAFAAAQEPQGTRIAFYRSGLMVTDTLGVGLSITAPGGSAGDPHWSSDRQWVYFQRDFGCCTQVGRVRPDGTGIQLLSTEPAIHPTPSPDGNSLAFMNGGHIRIMDLASRSVRTLTAVSGASFIRWSPDGQWIAYVHGDGIWVVKPDDTGNRRVSTRGGGTGLSWSPDSRWLLAQGQFVDVSAGLSTPVPWLGAHPAWRR